MNLAFVYRLQQLLFMYCLFVVYAAFQANKVVYTPCPEKKVPLYFCL